MPASLLMVVFHLFVRIKRSCHIKMLLPPGQETVGWEDRWKRRKYIKATSYIKFLYRFNCVYKWDYKCHLTLPIQDHRVGIIYLIRDQLPHTAHHLCRSCEMEPSWPVPRKGREGRREEIDASCYSLDPHCRRCAAVPREKEIHATPKASGQIRK